MVHHGDFLKGRKIILEKKDYECNTEKLKRRLIFLDLNSNSTIIVDYKYYEKYQGTNGIYYSSWYFIGEIKNNIMPDAMTTPNSIRKIHYQKK